MPKKGIKIKILRSTGSRQGEDSRLTRVKFVSKEAIMEGNGTVYRNMVVSTKVSAAQKVDLSRLAEKQGMSLSEFIHIILESYKNQFEYIGQDNPEVTKLKEENTAKSKRIQILKVERENADHCVHLRDQAVLKAQNKADEYKYALREKAADYEKLQEELENKVLKIERLEAEIEKHIPFAKENESLRKTMRSNTKLSAIGTLSMIAGLVIFNRR